MNGGDRPRLGLVLGAGGVRGCAHAGVISVLREAGIQVDVVVGVSVGAIFGLAFAAGWPTESIVGPAQTGSPRQLFRFYAGRLRPEARNPISQLVFEAGRGKAFEDLPLRFAVVATDMESHAPTVLDRGPVLPAVQASIAIPLVARPVQIDGRYYVDGGLFDTVPVRVARSMGADFVIAVCLGVNYVTPRFIQNRRWARPLLERAGSSSPQLTNGRLRDQLRFGCRLFVAGFDPPGLNHDADVTIAPDFGPIGPNALHGAAYCYEQGVSAAREALAPLRALLRATSHHHIA